MTGGKRRRVEWLLLVAWLVGACDGSNNADTGDSDSGGQVTAKNPASSVPGACTVQSDCAALGIAYTGNVCKDSICQPPVDPTWACLDSAPVIATGMLRSSITFVDLLSQMPLEGLALLFCARIDGTCSLPIIEDRSNSAGQIEFESPFGYDGYFQATGSGIAPTLIFLPTTRKQRQVSTIPLVSESFYPTLVQLVGATVAADRSLVLVTALDCLGRPAAGLTLTSTVADDQVASFVMAGGLPSRTASITDNTGQGGFINIPAGPATIQATLVSGNRLVGTRVVQARPGYMSMVFLTPNGS